MNRYFNQETILPGISASEAFAWHERPGAFERLAPPWEDLRVENKTGGVEDGARLTFRFRTGPVWQRWVAEHFDYRKGHQFCDRQVAGPFSFWEHLHRFEDREGGSAIVDEVRYRLMGAPLSDLAPRCLVEDKISAMFRHRRAVLQEDLRRHQEAGLPPQRIGITGASGLVGSALGAFLGGGGHTVVPFARSPRSGAIAWNTREGVTDPAAAEGLDAVVHLAGESVMGLWTAEKKKRIRESRAEGTRRLCESLARLEQKPKVLVSASAIGYYGDTADREVDEESPAGESFLASVGKEWEAATAPARDAGIRVVHIRVGIVLTPQGGALRAMLPAFRLGLGGALGDGRHFMSWIALDDLVYLFHHALARPEVTGVLNGVAPKAVTNREFTQTLAGALGRFVGPSAPAFLMKTVAPELSEEMLLVSHRVAPRRTVESGFRYRFEELDGALRFLLGRSPS